MAQEKIIIKFSAVGDKALTHAIKQLHASQVLLEKGSKEYRRVLKQLNLEQQKAIANTGALAVSHNRLGAQNKLLARSFATLRSQLLLVSFGAMLIERAFVSLVKAYGRQEAANEKLRVGLGNVAGTTEGVTQRLVDYSAALQQTTAFGDEMITTGMVQFTTFGLNEKAIKALTPQVLNVARAIQTVSGAMPDLNSLFIAFGKATTTGIGTLTRYGVVLTETERAQLGSMDANESAVKIAEILARQYGGLAEAYKNTTAGILEATDLARGDAAEAFGEVLAPAVLAVAKGLKIMFEAMSVENIKAYGSGLIIATTATTGLAIAMGRLNVQLALTKTAMIRTGIGALVVIAGLLTGKLLDMFGTFEDGGKILTDAEKKLKKFNEALEEDKRLAEELQKVQGDSVDSLQKQLDLLNASNDAEKMLINLGHRASEAELQLINQIISKTEALKAELQLKKDLAKTDKEIAKLEADIVKQKEAMAAKALTAEIKALKEEQQELAKTQEETIRAQEKLASFMEKFRSKELEDEYTFQLQKALDLEANMQQMIEIRDFYNEKITERDEQEHQALVDFHKKQIEENNAFYAMYSAGYDTFFNTLTDMEMTGKQRREAMWDAMKKSLVQFLADTLKEYILNLLATKAIRTGAEAANIASAAATGSAIATAYAAPAALAATATLGGAAVAGGAALTTTVALAHALAKAPPIAEQGGLIGGRRHSQGGTMINAEQGEFVMSRSAVQSVGIENLNRMNEGGGGGSVTVNVSGNVLSQDFVEGELAENIKEAIRRGTDFGIS